MPIVRCGPWSPQNPLVFWTKEVAGRGATLAHLPPLGDQSVGPVCRHPCLFDPPLLWFLSPMLQCPSVGLWLGVLFLLCRCHLWWGPRLASSLVIDAQQPNTNAIICVQSELVAPKQLDTPRNACLMLAPLY